MLRALALLLLLAAIPSAPAHAQPATEVCDNRFERFLKGYMVGERELIPFMDDEAALAACLKQLDAGNQDHALIEAYIHLERRHSSDEEAAARLFRAACAAGRKLGCAYAALWPPGRARVVLERRQILARLETLLDTDLPLVNAMVGAMRAAQQFESAADSLAARRLLQRASDQGDHMATRQLYAMAMLDIARGRPAHPLPWLVKAAEQGDIPAMLTLAQSELGDPERPGSEKPQAAFAWYKRAADSDPRFFQLAIAEASYELAKMLGEGKGTAIDGKEADRYLRRAAELGHEPAQKELERFKP